MCTLFVCVHVMYESANVCVCVILYLCMLCVCFYIMSELSNVCVGVSYEIRDDLKSLVTNLSFYSICFSCATHRYTLCFDRNLSDFIHSWAIECVLCVDFLINEAHSVCVCVCGPCSSPRCVSLSASDLIRQ